LAERAPAASGRVAVPEYLRRHYWWAYIHPWAVKFWDHLWIVNLILLCNYKRLRDALLKDFGQRKRKVLQVSCVYGDVSPKLANRVESVGGSLDVVDVLSIQLQNLKRKLSLQTSVGLRQMDSTNLRLSPGSYDDVVLFFLLHEQPAEVRKQTLREALRVVKPNGRIVIVDFAKPYAWNPFRYMWRVFLAVFEPFALGMWWHEISEMVPTAYRSKVRKDERFFGGLFQKVTIDLS